MHDTEAWSLPAVLAEQAQHRPHATWLTMADGESISFGQAYEDSRKVAGLLAGLGVQAGDRVAVLMSTGIDFVRAWMGLGYLGATAVLLNAELRGAFLSHQANHCGAELAIVDAELLPVLEELSSALRHLRRIVVVGERSGALPAFTYLSWSDWQAAATHPGAAPAPQQIACVMYTSGTSGPAKGVLMPHAHCYLMGLGQLEALDLRPDDRYYIVLPFFHANGLLLQLGATLIAGIPAVIRRRFSASRWLADIRRYDATVTNALGVVCSHILSQPATAHDRDHRLRAMMNVPNMPSHERAFRERFGVTHVISGFGMTEVNMPIWGRLGTPRPGAAGWVRADRFDVVIADPETDAPVGPGEIGEILVRPKVPFGFMAGYLDMPAQTVEAWRNLWFHTGDAGTMDEDGLVTFVDRIKDCIRRRSENISATEIESVVESMPGVAEVAAYAVPSDVPGGEDEVMLAIVPVERSALDLPALMTDIDQRLPRFARPRFVELVGDLPKTASGKIQRAVLRARGARAAWDRDRDAPR